ncbi:hypothetical protein LYSBPC_18240 [Lysinibacillus piscis]|uniref:DUF3886 domain-containing protein n=1 Tax=Lysinibacillus piscis TaxID=2518931 RepID=A0ABQ5NK66_9BACI|nr:hypothetical protein LYSBPC_18240 [Lysinibacillus sp. KH24]
MITLSATAFQRRRRELAAKAALEKEKKQSDELSQLRERAQQLGIENASKLGAKKLKELITEQEE